MTYRDDAKLPANAQLIVEELNADAYEAYLDRTAEVMECDDFGYARFFDISIADRSGNKVQPSAGVDVRVELLDTDGFESDFSVVHFAGVSEHPEQLDAAADGNIVSFRADGFSVYAIVEAREAPVIMDEDVYDLTELAERYNVPDAGGKGFYISYTNIWIIISYFNFGYIRFYLNPISLRVSRFFFFNIYIC